MCTNSYIIFAIVILNEMATKFSKIFMDNRRRNIKSIYISFKSIKFIHHARRTELSL